MMDIVRQSMLICVIGLSIVFFGLFLLFVMTRLVSRLFNLKPPRVMSEVRTPSESDGQTASIQVRSADPMEEIAAICAVLLSLKKKPVSKKISEPVFNPWVYQKRLSAMPLHKRKH